MTFEFWNICVLTVLGLCCWVTEPGQFASRHCWGPEAGAVWTRLPTQNQTCRCRLLSWPMCWVCLSSITVATSCPSASYSNALREMPSEPPKEVQGGCGCIPDVPGSVPVVHWTLCLFFSNEKTKVCFIRSLLKGQGAKWSTLLLLSMSVLLNDLANFVTHVKTAWTNPQRVENANQWICCPRQDKGVLSAYATRYSDGPKTVEAVLSWQATSPKPLYAAVLLCCRLLCALNFWIMTWLLLFGSALLVWCLDSGIYVLWSCTVFGLCLLPQVPAWARQCQR